MPDAYDVFLSYARPDRDRVAALADRLLAEGLTVAWDEAFIQTGDLIVVKIDEAIRNSANSILVFSTASIGSAWVENEYAALMKLAIERRRRFIPVLTEDVSLPPLAEARSYADLRESNRPNWDRVLQKIIRALQSAGAPPPSPA
ncbi:toll/interleukin-1 receptor domain-containing protein [Nonomuraea glycinis]|uniref:TIR domain-containing protein n=1 Tax=Nonomuraea glycinis TaxID=2047744 RepID=A0A918A146_9ACTN|nr:toll/interleukin-1 receptor domain-containing protein [Nonomuraea glycinis]MCA2174664.1 toll/interleukin-1 receptor domain-containing protein [Nonomuraea glycinis]GGP01921.1 hypothetical protein GCM10012278_07090 [Nonomuraea glycinis]